MDFRLRGNDVEVVLRGNDAVDLRGSDVADAVARVCDIGVESGLPWPEHFTNKPDTKSTDG